MAYTDIYINLVSNMEIKKNGKEILSGAKKPIG